ncbi:MAG: hypothetical protein NC307_10975 [Roseburia sp.]|nr:hypothetical protein [Roseburia sp.]
MRDMIDERNERERSSRSIVKSYNVHYMTAEELAEQERLRNQANEQPAASIPEEVPQDTPSQEPVKEEKNLSDDPVTQEQIEKILGEREEQNQHLIEEIKHQ